MAFLLQSNGRVDGLTMCILSDAYMALRMLLSSCCPMWLEIMAQAPMETPINRFINNPMTGALLPTAASALLPTKWPTTATSTELKSSCNKLLAASGRANSKIFLNNGPFSISISLLWARFLVTLLSIFYLLQNARQIYGKIG